MLRTRLALELKSFLDNNQVDIFHSNEIFELFPNVEKRFMEKVLQEVTDLEYTSIEKGKYCRNTFRNEYAIANALTVDAIIAYWSALNIHGLTEQFPNKVYVQTTKNKIDKEVFGIEYQFIRIKPNKLIGFDVSGAGSNKFRISNIEKTIVDCFDLVQYSGGFMELIRAFYRTKLNVTKLIEYSTAVGNKAAVKRMGFLAELLQKNGMNQFIRFAKKFSSDNYDLFDKQGYDEGYHIADWKLKMNMEKSEIIDIANSIY
jgi:predicted transcriptional regulator of viral defense system